MAEEFDVVVIGSGPGGYVAAIRAAQLKLKTAVVEMRKELGGTCLNVGCIPSKALLHSSELFWKFLHEAPQLGIQAEKVTAQFPHMMERKNKIVASFNQGIDALFQKNKIKRFLGVGTLQDPHTIAITYNGKQETISARSIILATGSEPIALPFLPFDEKRVVSSTGALSFPQIPKKLLVVGAGVIGVELGSVYSRLGSDVTFIEFLDRICPTLDLDLTKTFQQILEKQGMKFHLSSKVIGAELSEKQVRLKVETPQGPQEFEGDSVLISIGRKPYTTNLGLENVGIEKTAKGFIPINGQFRTAISHIYAIGDIVDGPMLAHKASEEGIAVAEIIAGHQPQINYLAIPSVVYTHPEAAAVGLTEAEAKQLNLEYTTGTFPFKVNSRAKCTGEDEGFVKILAESKTDHILGIQILGAHASELIAAAAVALEKRMKVLELATTPFAHPTLSEAIKEAALALHKRALHK